MQKKIKAFTPTPNFYIRPDEERLKVHAQPPKNLVRGFTLVELLLVIGIIATLAVVVFVALDPAKRFQDSRDAKRVSDVETILSAVHQYVIDNKGAFPDGLDQDTERMLGTYGASCEYYNGGCDVSTGACLNLADELSKYLKTIPFDPQMGNEQETYYSILRDGSGIIMVRACAAEGSQISVSR